MTYPTWTSEAKRLADSGARTATYTGTVGGVARVFDTGSTPTKFDGFAIIKTTAITTAGGQTYTFKLRASNSLDGSGKLSGSITEMRSVVVAQTGEKPCFAANHLNGSVVGRYLEIEMIPTGSSPSITFEVWLLAKEDLSTKTQAELLGITAVAMNRFTEASSELRRWAFGSATGGPNSDGTYPLSDGDGNSVLTPCPAKIALTGFSVSGVNALPELQVEDLTGVDWSSDAEVILKVGGELFKTPIAFIRSRQTLDLAPWTLGADGINDLMQEVIEPSTNLSKKMSIREIERKARGIVTPQQFGAQGDAIHSRGVNSTNGSSTLVADYPIFTAYYVGKEIHVSNAKDYGGFGGLLKTTITSYINPYQVTVAETPTWTQSNDVSFGTDDTLALQAMCDFAKSPANTPYIYGWVAQLTRGLTGGYWTRGTVYGARMGFYGQGVRQTQLMTKDDPSMTWLDIFQSTPSTTTPCLRNATRQDDFCAGGQFSINGCQYLQTQGRMGFNYWPEHDGTIPMPQVDPYPIFTHMHVHDCGWDGVVFYGRHSGTFAMSETVACGGAGVVLNCYDANVVNILSIGHQAAAFSCGGANNNIMNLKASYSGTTTWQSSFRGRGANAVLAVSGGGNNFLNARLQESYSDLCYINGTGNKLIGMGNDDAGCIGAVGGHQDPWGLNPDPVRAMICFGAGAQDNEFHLTSGGPAVHVDFDPSTGEPIYYNYATHAVYFEDDTSSRKTMRNEGQLKLKGYPTWSWFAGAGGSGATAPSIVGYANPSGIDPSNYGLNVAGQSISAYI